MKQMILGFCFLVMIIYAVYINMNVCARMNRETELSQVVSHCVRQTLWMDAAHGIHGNKNMKSFFEWIFHEEMSSKGRVDIDYVVLNQSLGLFSVKVTQHYQTPDGKHQQISVKKSAYIKGKKRKTDDSEPSESDEVTQTSEEDADVSEDEKTASSGEDAEIFDQYEDLEIQMSEIPDFLDYSQ